MTQRKYDKATAQAIMQWAYSDYQDGQNKPYEVRDDGVYVNDVFRDYCPPGTIYDWTPADCMDVPESPNPDTAPALPIPFTAADLAACMLDGIGHRICQCVGAHIGSSIDESELPDFRPRMRWMRDALREAYALAAEAQNIVGELDHAQQQSAHDLCARYSDAYDQAIERERVMERVVVRTKSDGSPEHGDFISRVEYLRRLERAKASVSDLKAQADSAKAQADDKHRTWREAMVRQLLNPEQPIAKTVLETDSSNNATACDFSMLATREQLIEAFGRFTGLDASWFTNLKDTPALLAARKVTGQGGRGHIAEPLFCPFTVMQWLADSKRRKGRKLSAEKAWELLEKYFPKVYDTRSVADPRAGD